MVKFLLEHLEKSGCAVGDGFIKAVHCEKKIAGGYTRGGGVLYIYIFPSFLLVSLKMVLIFTLGSNFNFVIEIEQMQ